MSKIEAPADSYLPYECEVIHIVKSGEGPLPGSELAIFLLRPHVVFPAPVTACPHFLL